MDSSLMNGMTKRRQHAPWHAGVRAAAHGLQAAPGRYGARGSSVRAMPASSVVMLM